MTAKKILINWLSKHIGEHIYYHDIEREVVDFGVNFHRKLHNGGSYSRAFRDLKENDQAELKKQGLFLIENFQQNGVGRWKIVKWREGCLIM